jgi:hypothetical protein
MGEPVIPLILHDLQERGGDWYPALRAITNVSPVSPGDRGNVARMNEAWLKWGRKHGYLD